MQRGLKTKMKERSEVSRPRFLYALKNAELNGNLEAFLQEAKATGKSYGKIAKELSAVGTPVAKTTAYEWMLELSSVEMA